MIWHFRSVFLCAPFASHHSPYVLLWSGLYYDSTLVPFCVFATICDSMCWFMIFPVYKPCKSVVGSQTWLRSNLASSFVSFRVWTVLFSSCEPSPSDSIRVTLPSKLLTLSYINSTLCWAFHASSSSDVERTVPQARSPFLRRSIPSIHNLYCP